MDLDLFLKFFNIYSWAVASIIMIFMAAIARFYQKKFGIRTHYYLYFIPSIVFFIVFLQIFPFFGIEQELIEFFSSVISVVAGYFLYMKMVGIK
ncbi:MAG: hypothetical protein C3F06_13770 [Candidatus Methanoperedenaceae archaeon]|nr:MAG: hypothetical protein C3F06_13770 [Candidatus Methanoperedenaceae archaeon]